MIDELRSVHPHPKTRDIRRIMDLLKEKYPKCILDTLHGVPLGTGTEGFLLKLINRNDHLKRFENPLKRKKAIGHPEKQTYTYDSYGCVNWGPTVPNKEALQNKMISLKENITITENEEDNIMDDIYPLIRQKINFCEKESIIEGLLDECPSLFKEKYILSHFYKLTGKKIEAVVMTNLAEKSRSILLLGQMGGKHKEKNEVLLAEMNRRFKDGSSKNGLVFGTILNLIILHLDEEKTSLLKLVPVSIYLFSEHYNM